MAIINFPDEGPAGQGFKRLCQLHPGTPPTVVVIRAMTAYHCMYEMHLEGAACACVDTIMEHLDQQDEEMKGRGEWPE